MNIRKFLRKISYPFRMRFIEQPHIIRIKHPDISPYRWTDRDNRMLYGMFQILVDFVEKETWDGVEGIKVSIAAAIDPTDEWAKASLEFNKELLNLYEWWTFTRPAQQKALWTTDFEGPHRIENGGHFDFTPEYSAYLRAEGEKEERYHEQDNEMLIRLVKIRRCLWT